jgi:Ribosome biogenesis protein Nop16
VEFVDLPQGDEESVGESMSEDESSEEEQKKPVPKSNRFTKPEPGKADLAQIFGLKNEKDIVYEDCVKKLSSDDASMMRQLIRKYGDDFKRMFVDIKLNFMQYSKGQLKAKYRSYFHYGHDQPKK